MMPDSALRLGSMMMALAFVQQSLEHLRPAARRDERLLFMPRLLLSLLLAIDMSAPSLWLPPGVLMLGLLANQLLILPFFNGPYNGGADRMGLLVLLCLTAAWLVPPGRARELAMGYLGMQLMLSYLISGWVKVVNPSWRSGQALRDVFQYSAYPVSESLRRWGEHPVLLRVAGWGVMGFELAFPLAFLSRWALVAALLVAMLFHGANACLFGLNRFFWIWISGYPALLWLQDRVLA